MENWCLLLTQVDCRHVFHISLDTDTVVWCRYDGESVRPAGANLRSFLIECLAGPLVGSDPRQVHAFCDLYEHARHSYKQFGAREYGSYAQLLDQLTGLVTSNTERRPEQRKSGTPVHNKPVNRPRKRLGSSHSVSHNMKTFDVR